MWSPFHTSFHFRLNHVYYTYLNSRLFGVYTEDLAFKKHEYPLWVKKLTCRPLFSNCSLWQIFNFHKLTILSLILYSWFNPMVLVNTMNAANARPRGRKIRNLASFNNHIQFGEIFQDIFGWADWIKAILQEFLKIKICPNVIVTAIWDINIMTVKNTCWNGWKLHF